MRPGREHALQAAQVEVEAIGMPTVCTDKITAMRQTDRQTDIEDRFAREMLQTWFFYSGYNAWYF